MKKYQFSRRHWMNIVLCFFLFVLNNACTTDGQNVILPRLAEQNGWDYSLVLLWASAAGIFSVAGQLVIGRMCARHGAKRTIIFCLFATAGFLMVYSSAHVMWLYGLGLFGVTCCSTSYSYLGANGLIANWFPQKKGLAMGIVSVGAPVSTIVMVSLLTMLITALGIFRGVLFLSLILAALAILCIFAVHDRPEECGETPDNMPAAEFEKLVVKEEHESTLPIKELLKNRNLWRIVVVMGFCNMSLTGVMAQFLVRMTDSGYPEQRAIFLMSVCAAIGIFGSVLSGNLEHRLGTRRAYALAALIFAAALVINATDIPALIYVSIPMIGCEVTILQIYLSAFEVSVFGRTNFEQANAVIYPLVSMLGQLTFVVISLSIRLFGGVRYAYFVFAALLAVSVLVSRGIKESDRQDGAAIGKWGKAE